jgi:hypothetical protein
MKLDKGMTIGALPVKAVRDFLRETPDTSFSTDFAEDKLGMTPDEAVAFFKLLEAEGLIELHPDFQHEEPKRFQTSIKGNALCLAKFVLRISRARADEIVAGFKQRCAQVNSDPYYLCSVKKAVAFGSYAGDSPDVGDIDIFVWLEEKEKDRAKATRLCRERAEAKGKSWQWSYAYEETLRFLKARPPYLSFSRSDADLELADKLVTLFEGVT